MIVKLRGKNKTTKKITVINNLSQTVWTITKSNTASNESCATTTGTLKNDTLFEKT